MTLYSTPGPRLFVPDPQASKHACFACLLDPQTSMLLRVVHTHTVKVPCIIFPFLAPTNCISRIQEAVVRDPREWVCAQRASPRSWRPPRAPLRASTAASPAPRTTSPTPSLVSAMHRSRTLCDTRARVPPHPRPFARACPPSSCLRRLRQRPVDLPRCIRRLHGPAR